MGPRINVVPGKGPSRISTGGVDEVAVEVDCSVGDAGDGWVSEDVLLLLFLVGAASFFFQDCFFGGDLSGVAGAEFKMGRS